MIEEIKYSKIKDIKRIIRREITIKLGKDYLEDYVLDLMSSQDKVWIKNMKKKETEIINNLNSQTTAEDVYRWNTMLEISKYTTILGG